MGKTIVAIISLSLLAACGGGNRYANNPTRGASFLAPTLYATGPIQKACQLQGRKEATSARCGCVQAVANQSLSSSDQRRGAKYFKDPHKIQEMRQSDNSNHNEFWKAWKAFGQTASAICAQT